LLDFSLGIMTGLNATKSDNHRQFLVLSNMSLYTKSIYCNLLQHCL